MRQQNPTIVGKPETHAPTADSQAAEQHRPSVAEVLRNAFWETSYRLASLLLGRQSHRRP